MPRRVGLSAPGRPRALRLRQHDVGRTSVGESDYGRWCGLEALALDLPTVFAAGKTTRFVSASGCYARRGDGPGSSVLPAGAAATASARKSAICWATCGFIRRARICLMRLGEFFAGSLVLEVRNDRTGFFERSDAFSLGGVLRDRRHHRPARDPSCALPVGEPRRRCPQGWPAGVQLQTVKESSVGELSVLQRTAG